jgi:microcystin degradation protein MlrC
MRIVIAKMKHETNTFSPLVTDLARFEARGSYFGNEAIERYGRTQTPFGAFVTLAREAGATIDAPVVAEAWPSGRVTAEAYERISRPILDAVARGCDAVFLDLHGAMVSDIDDDGEGLLLERIRAIAPGVPIAVALDFHTNLTERMVRNCTAMVGYKTFPHVDTYETGLQAGRIVLRALKGEIEPVMRWARRPLMTQTLCQATDEEPMAGLIAAARAAEAGGALAATVFGGFAHADIADVGLSAVVVTDGDPEGADRICADNVDRAWAKRGDFVYRAEPLAQSIARAKAMTEGPVLLIDHCDNTGSGGTQDVMTVLAEIVRQGLTDVAVFAIRDPGAVETMIRAGVGAKVALALGGKTDMPAVGLKGAPLEVSGIVRNISDGEFTITAPMFTGVRAYLGRSAVLDTGAIEIVVCERSHEPWDLGCFRSNGIEPMQKKYIMLKSRIHYRAGFKPIARHIVECNGTGCTTSDNAILRYERARRPIYPLDPAVQA